MTKKRLFIILGSLILALVIAAFIWGGKQELPEVKTIIAQIEDVVERVSASGKIQPELEVSVSAEVSGQLIELPVKEGDVVAEGDLLAVINPDLYNSALNRAQAAVNTTLSNLSSAKAMLASSESGYFVAEQAWERNRVLFDSGASVKYTVDVADNITIFYA